MRSRRRIVKAVFVVALFACSLAYGQPTLLSPANGTINLPLQITVSWNSVGVATTYGLEIAAVADFSNPLINQSGLASTAQVINGLSRGITYYWRVNSTTGTGPTSAWSSVWSFATIPVIPSAPVLSSPATGSADQSFPLNVNWATVSGADYYTLQISSVSTFSNLALNKTNIATPPATIGAVAGTNLSPSTTYYWRVNATNAGGTGAWSAAWNFTTAVFPAAAPVLSFPTNGAVNQPTALTLTWNTVANASSYSIWIDTHSDFSSSFTTGSTAAPQFPVSAFGHDAVYYWKVLAMNGNGTSPWSSVWHFTTGPVAPATPVLSLPANGAIGLGASPTLSWNSSAGAASYTVQVATISDFSTTAINKTGIASISSSVSGIAYGAIYFWRASATNASGTSAWSVAWSFTTVSGIPATPTLISPANLAVFKTIAPALNWSLVIGAASYGLQVSTASNFSSTVFGQTGIASNSQTVSLKTGGLYYWRVNAANTAGTSAWTGAWMFVAGVDGVLPSGIALATPFVRIENGMLSYSISRSEAVRISLYDVLGRQVLQLQQHRSAGIYRVSFRDFKLAAGRYLLHFKAGALEKSAAVLLSSR